MGHTVIRFVSISAKFGIYTVVGLKGTLVESEIRTFKCPGANFSFNKCPISTQKATTLQMPNLTLIEKKRITVQEMGKSGQL